jgi:DNA mismatch repair protein MLH1
MQLRTLKLKCFGLDKSSGSSSIPEYKYVRTDSRVTTLDTFVHNNKSKQEAQVTNTVQVVQKPRVEVRLTSVLQLRKQVKKQENIGTIV